MLNNYKYVPLTVSPTAINLVAEISAQMERFAIRMEQSDRLRLRKAKIDSDPFIDFMLSEILNRLKEHQGEERLPNKLPNNIPLDLPNKVLEQIPVALIKKITFLFPDFITNFSCLL